MDCTFGYNTVKWSATDRNNYTVIGNGKPIVALTSIDVTSGMEKFFTGCASKKGFDIQHVWRCLQRNTPLHPFILYFLIGHTNNLDIFCSLRKFPLVDFLVLHSVQKMDIASSLTALYKDFLSDDILVLHRVQKRRMRISHFLTAGMSTSIFFLQYVSDGGYFPSRFLMSPLICHGLRLLFPVLQIYCRSFSVKSNIVSALAY